ncbi:MAG: right-handed parallel beta-helix repeat-containing protein [Geobacter sp.]|nr:right-handed parallel beta-helix repeat-containing protein [Geobacter sp.]
MKRIEWVSFVLIMLMVASTAMAETYYVRPDGNNSNTGLGDFSQAAWATIQYAADNVAPGDTIMVQSGTYSENVTIKNSGLPDLPIKFQGIGTVRVGSFNFPGVNTFSGSVSYYNTIDNFKFDGNLGLSAYGIRIYGSGLITVSNCSFENLRAATWESAGILFINNAWRSCYSITVKDCLFKNNTWAATAPGSGMLYSSLFDNCIFIGNEIGYYASNWGTSYTTFNKCTFDGNQFGAILEGVYWYWLKTHHNTFTRCIFKNNNTGLLIGDKTASNYNGASYANSVINSDFYDNIGAGILVNTNFTGTNDGGAAYYNSLGQTFTNNIFLNNGTYGIDNAVNQTIYASFNLAYQNGTGAGNNAIIDASNNSLTTDPKLVDPTNGDFNLRYDSPCIDAGNSAFDNDPARQGTHIDIGAFEANPAPAQLIAALTEQAGNIPESYLKNKNNSLPLSKKLYVAMQMIIRGDEAADAGEKGNFYNSALNKLENDILPKTDGCALNGAPDNNDWIQVCETQLEFYGPIVDLINRLRTMGAR